MQSSVVDLVTNVVQDPITAVLVAMGALFIGGASAVLGYLSLGAAIEFVTPH